jgi:Flp pilus assembly protein TadB
MGYAMTSPESKERRFPDDPEATLLLSLAEELNSARRSDLFYVYRHMLDRQAREKDLVWRAWASMSACGILVFLSILAALGSHEWISWYHAGAQMVVGIVGILAGSQAIWRRRSYRRRELMSPELQGAVQSAVAEFSVRLTRSFSMASREQEFTYSSRGLLP